MAGILPGSVPLILTDIPYDKDFLSQLPDLAAFAQRLLVEGGLFICLCGQYYLNQVFKNFEEYLTYRWVDALVWEGDANVIQPLQIASQWKP